MAAPPPAGAFFVNADPVLRATKEKAEKGDKAAALKLCAASTIARAHDRQICALHTGGAQ